MRDERDEHLTTHDEHQDWVSVQDRDLITFGYSERDPIRDEWHERVWTGWTT